jgi:hypothetical protein
MPVVHTSANQYAAWLVDILSISARACSCRLEFGVTYSKGSMHEDETAEPEGNR